MKRQSELLQHTTTIYLNPQIALYAKELTDRLPGNLKVSLQTFFPACMTLQPLYIRLIRASMAGNATLSARVMQPLSMASSALEQPLY